MIHSADENVTANENSMIIRDSSGEIISEYSASATSTDAKQKMLEDFVERLDPSQEEPLAHDEANDLNTIAVIESAYLSARTSAPETPEEGAVDIWQRANASVREVLKDHHPGYIESGQDSKIRSQFKILLP